MFYFEQQSSNELFSFEACSWLLKNNCLEQHNIYLYLREALVMYLSYESHCPKWWSPIKGILVKNPIHIGVANYFEFSAG